jgi:hypothetical protein
MEDAVKVGHNLRVSGPPGTGKSTEAWAWGLWKAWTTQKKVVWFHFSEFTSSKVVIDGASKQVKVALSAKISDIEASVGDFLIVDGMTKNDSVEISRACYAWSKQQDKRLFVTVSSVSIPVALQEEEEANVKSYSVPSWTLEQYQQACEDNFFQRCQV